MGGRFSWLGGRADTKGDAASIKRARAHRRAIPKATRAERRWERADRNRFGG